MPLFPWFLDFGPEPESWIPEDPERDSYDQRSDDLFGINGDEGEEE